MQAAVQKQGALCVANDLPIEYSLATKGILSS